MPIMSSIKREILVQSPNTEVQIVPFEATLIRAVKKFRPDVILTFPMGSAGVARLFYLFKLYRLARVLCFRSEGILDPGVPANVANHIGFDRYGSRLIDAEIFWGPGPAKLIGDALLAQGKLSSRERIKYFGYPRLERYFRNIVEDTVARLPEPVAVKLREFGRERTVLIATGFHFANYTRQDLFTAGDLDAENRCDELLEVIEKVKGFRADWIAAVREVSSLHPSLLFVVKKHPNEGREDYVSLEGQANVLMIWQDVDIGDLIQASGVFFNYGSTSQADAYLARVPVIYVYSKDPVLRAWFPDMGWPAARSIPIENMGVVVQEFGTGCLKSEMTPAMKEVLEYNFNVRDGFEYHPTSDLASFLLADVQPQRIPLTDPYLWEALGWYFHTKVRQIVGWSIRHMFGIIKGKVQPKHG